MNPRFIPLRLTFIGCVVLLFNLTLSQAVERKGYPLYCIPRFEKFLGRDYPLKTKETGPQTEHNHFQFGYEIEYPLAELEKTQFFSYYAPDESLIPRSEWDKLTSAKKTEWMKTNLQRVFPSKKSPGKLSLVVKGQGAELPETVVLDSTGNIEIITHRPFDVFREFTDSFAQSVHLFGSGYMQAMISYPGSVVYKSKEASDSFVGLRFFLGEYDQLEKLVDGFGAYLAKKDSERPYIPAKSFAHPYLGPMNSYRAEFFRSLVTENRFDRFSTEVLDRVTGENASYKYTSQSVYRPDVLRSQKRVLVEIRDCVKDADCIQKRLEREISLLKHSQLSNFSRFAQVKHFDAVAHFNLFSEPVQKALKAAFPRKLEKPIAEETGGEILAGELYRNFSYPLNDWSTWVKAIGFNAESSQMKKVESAALAYRKALEDAAKDLDEKNAKMVEQFGDKARIALAQFAKDSELKTLLGDWFKKYFSEIQL